MELAEDLLELHPSKLITADAELSENPVKGGRDQLIIPKRELPRQAVGDPQALAEAAKLLANADYPVIVAGRAADSQAMSMPS